MTATHLYASIGLFVLVTFCLCTLAYILVGGVLRAMLWLWDSDLRAVWSRLRAWLRPYPDDAQMQVEMLRRVRDIIHRRRYSRFEQAVQTALVEAGWKVSKSTAPKNFSFHVGVAHPDSQLGDTK